MGKVPISRESAQDAGFWTKKRLGQHLLRDASVVKDIIKAIDAKSDEGILEIGPGLGALTESLLMLNSPITAVEVDPAACQVLKERFNGLGADKFTLVEADVLKTDLHALCKKTFKGADFHIAANLPYYITTPILADVIESGLPFGRMVVLAQKEVADRLAAKPGSKTYGALSVMAQFRCEVKLLRKVLPGAFTPPPKVDSGLVLFTRRLKPAVQVADEAWFFKITRACFGKRRKTMRNGLKMGGLNLEDAAIDLALAAAGIDPKVRPENLGMEHFAALTSALPRPSQD